MSASVMTSREKSTAKVNRTEPDRAEPAESLVKAEPQLPGEVGVS